MFTERSGKQNRLEMVILEDLVPQDHLLRKIDKAINFSFINKICKPYYISNIFKYLYEMGIEAAMGSRRGCQ